MASVVSTVVVKLPQLTAELRHMIGTLRARAWQWHHRAYLHSSTPYRSTSSPQYYFDTLKLVKRLEQEGFSPKQSRAVMGVLSDVIDDSLKTVVSTMVSREDHEKSMYTQRVDFAHLRSELQTLEKNDITLSKSEHERLANEISKLAQKFKEEVNKVQANVRLDLNLEKGRTRDESSVHELKIKETDTRMETEFSNMRTQLEATKFQLLQWLFGVMTGAGALMLAYIRLIS